MRSFSPWYRNQQSHKLHGNSRRKSNLDRRRTSPLSFSNFANSVLFLRSCTSTYLWLSCLGGLDSTTVAKIRAVFMHMHWIANQPLFYFVLPTALSEFPKKENMKKEPMSLNSGKKPRPREHSPRGGLLK